MPLFTLMHLYTPILPCKNKIASFIYKKKRKFLLTAWGLRHEVTAMCYSGINLKTAYYFHAGLKIFYSDVS